MSMEMNKANECTCPSGDGSLVHPCPAHPAVEQAGGDERAAFERAFTVQEGIYFDGKRGEYRSMNLRAIEATDAQDLNLRLQGWQARAALAQPSPKSATCGGTGMVDDGEITCSQGGIPYENCPVKCVKDCPDCKAQPSPAQSEQAEAERPEIVAFRGLHEPLTTVAECEHIVVTLRAKIAQLRQHKNDYMDAGQETYRALQNEIREREAEIARLDGLVSSRTAERDAAQARVAELKTMADNYCALLMDANAKLAELEKQEPINLQHMAVAADGELRWMTGRKIDNCELYAMPDFGQAPKLYAAPVAQAQQLNDLDKQCRDDVARALGLRPNQERGFAWSYLLASIKSCVKASEDSAKAQHSVPELLEWAVDRWHAEVSLRPLINVHRRALDDTWRQVIRHLGGDTGLLCGPSHDELLAAAPGNSAQHSVPEQFSFEYRHPNGESHTVTVSRDQVINEMPDFLFEALCSKLCNCEPAGETNVVECCCDEYAEEFKLLAAAPVCRLSRSALTDAQMRRLYDSSTETENERLGFAAFARLIRRAEAVHQIAAAPGKEVGHE